MNANTDTGVSENDSASGAVLQCRRLSKVFDQGPLSVKALRDIDLAIGKGERIALVGASGSGKSTLLHILGGLSRPSTGVVLVEGRDISSLPPKSLGELRNRTLGFVYQFHHLLMEFTALENVAMPLLIRRAPRREALTQAGEILERVGLGHRLAHKPAELSGGERQRAAVARAMVTRPKCILADEPTGNLDRKTAESIQDLLVELNQAFATSLLVATHDPALARKMERVVVIEDGVIVSAE